MIAGFGIPVHLKIETVIVGTVFKAVYKLPKNITELETYVTYERKRRSATRWDIYQLLAQALEM